MRSTSHDGERASARARAEAIASAAGLTLERAIAQLNYDEVRAANPNNPFAGMDEWMEIKEPGHIDRMKAEKAERRRIWAERRAVLIKAYGSVDAIIAPCERETLILAAVKPWRKAQKAPHHRWTDTIDGWRGLFSQDVPAHIRSAIQRAYPMPTTFRDLKAIAEAEQRTPSTSVQIMPDRLADDTIEPDPQRPRDRQDGWLLPHHGRQDPGSNGPLGREANCPPQWTDIRDEGGTS